MDIAFIGFGEAGQAFATSLMATAPVTIRAYDILTDRPEGEAILQASARIGATLLPPTETLADADLVFSAVTAAESLQAIAAVADHLSPGQLLFDINSVSAARKQETARIVRAKGAAYIDMAVMAPVDPAAHRTPVLVAGDIVGRAEEILQRFEFRYEVISAREGDATSIKMIRSLFVKGVEALTVQALLAAEAAGCRERILASLSASYAGLGWPAFAEYQFERVATHGVRRAAEMRESANSLRGLGFDEGGALADAIAGLQQRIGAEKLALPRGTKVPEAVAAVLARIGKPEP